MKDAKSKALHGAMKDGREETRAEEISRINAGVAKEGLKMVARGRHERRHKDVKGTSLAERHSWMKQMSKDS